MRKTAFAIFAQIALLLTGCASTLPADIRSTIAACGAGFGVSLGASAEIDAAQIITGTTSGTAELRSEFIAGAMSSLDVSEANAVELYSEYVSCIAGDDSRQELFATLDQRVPDLRSAIRDWGSEDDLSRFNQLYETYRASLSNRQFLLAHETHRKLQTLIAKVAVSIPADEKANFFFRASQGTPTNLTTAASLPRLSTELDRCIIHDIPACDYSELTWGSPFCCDAEEIRRYVMVNTRDCVEIANIMSTLFSASSSFEACESAFYNALKNRPQDSPFSTEPCDDQGMGPGAIHSCIEKLFEPASTTPYPKLP